MKQNTCCFSGHRTLPPKKIGSIIARLSEEIDCLVRQGVTDFISGGALGFDQLAASLVIAKREMGHDIRLIFALPCRNQDKGWAAEQKNCTAVYYLKPTKCAISLRSTVPTA